MIKSKGFSYDSSTPSSWRLDLLRDQHRFELSIANDAIERIDDLLFELRVERRKIELGYRTL